MGWVDEVLGVENQGGPFGTDAYSTPTDENTFAGLDHVQRAQAATIDPAQQAQGRGYQQALANFLQAQATGTGPSIADAQLRQATDRNTAGALGMMAAAKSINPGLAARLAGTNAATANQQAGGQSAIARLAEQQQAAGLLGQVTGQMRGQDLDLANAQAGLTQQANLFNAGQYDQQLLAALEARRQLVAQRNAQIASMDAQRRAANYQKFSQLMGAATSAGSAAAGGGAVGAPAGGAPAPGTGWNVGQGGGGLTS